MYDTPTQILEQTFSCTESVEYPHANDVLCGRGVTTNKHPGNEQFRSLINGSKESYVTSTKKGKMMVSKSIVDAVRDLKPKGRFLEKDTTTSLWYDIGNRKAVEKTSQALRDSAAVMRKQLFQDLSNPDFLSAVFDADDGMLPNSKKNPSSQSTKKRTGNSKKSNNDDDVNPLLNKDSSSSIDISDPSFFKELFHDFDCELGTHEVTSGSHVPSSVHSEVRKGKSSLKTVSEYSPRGHRRVRSNPCIRRSPLEQFSEQEPFDGTCYEEEFVAVGECEVPGVLRAKEAIDPMDDVAAMSPHAYFEKAAKLSTRGPPPLTKAPMKRRLSASTATTMVESSLDESFVVDCFEQAMDHHHHVEEYDLMDHSTSARNLNTFPPSFDEHMEPWPVSQMSTQCCESSPQFTVYECESPPLPPSNMRACHTRMPAPHNYWQPEESEHTPHHLMSIPMPVSSESSPRWSSDGDGSKSEDDTMCLSPYGSKGEEDTMCLSPHPYDHPHD